MTRGPLGRKSHCRVASRRLLVGVDTGGTFTDLVCLDGHRLRVHKLLSTPDNPARAVLQGLATLLGERSIEKPASARRASAVEITYGSTVATNALLERKGARVVLLTTAGFEDLLEIGRQTRPALYALEPRKPPPLVPRTRRVGVPERVTFDGRSLQRPSLRAMRAAIASARRAGADSIAICFLHAYANPTHELALGRAARRLRVPCSLSHQLLAEYREYERLSTTVINAYVAPVMGRHLGELKRGVGRAALRVMQSNGGAVSIRTASREAVRTLLSGPAAGVIGALAVARRAGIEKIVTFDMGGTSTDVCLVDGEVLYQTEWDMAGLPVKVPAIDIHTVGAGGGSIAYRDAGGALKVGPESAGAEPGPACYGRGAAPTVTDADVVLGRLVPDAFLGGRMKLDPGRALGALRELGRALRLSPEQAAEGVVRVVNAGMERAIRRISVERGHDPRFYTLVAFGGAAGMHACELAAGLGMSRVLLPYHPGVLSACGALAADTQRDYVQTVRLTSPRVSEIRRLLAPLLRRARREIRTESAARGDLAVEAFLDLRYVGQSYEIRLPMSRNYEKDFHVAHRRLYGYAEEQRPVELVNLRVIGALRTGRIPRFSVPPRVGSPSRHRLKWGGRWVRAKRIAREALPGLSVHGPLVITEFSATTVVPPGWTVRPCGTGDLLLERQV